MNLVITIAGASGFIGRELIKKIQGQYQINGLSRSQKKSTIQVRWTKTDLFSFGSINRALKNTDIAIYLVHSMLPSSRLFQGNFQDTDLLLADNFSKACKKNGVKKIIYLSGLLPDSGYSEHLNSRKEVENVLQSSGIPTTVLRAGMIVGDGGSSFEILKNLVFNLPLLLLPRWTKSTTQALYIDDLISVIEAAISNESFSSKTINVVNGEKLTYADLIRQTSEGFSKKKILISVPINSKKFSKFWVRLFGQSDYELVSPLIESLSCNLPCPTIPEELQNLIKYKSYKSMLTMVSKQKTKRRKLRKPDRKNNVRSIQRLPNPASLSEQKISEEYVNWLPQFMRFLIIAERNKNFLRFFLVGFKTPLLTLEKTPDNGVLNRVKFHIVGGFLSKSSDTGWLEFRIVAKGSFTLSSINEFIPSLPWFIYKFTQAPLHAFVMKAFGKHLNVLNSSKDN